MDKLKQYSKWAVSLLVINLSFSLLIGWFLTGLSFNNETLSFATAWLAGSKIVGLTFIIQKLTNLFKTNDKFLEDEGS